MFLLSDRCLSPQFGSTDTPDFFEDCDDPKSNSDNCMVDRPTTDPNSMTAKENQNKLEDLLTTESWTIDGKKELTDRPKWFSASPGGIDGTLEYSRSGMTLECTVENTAMGYEVGGLGWLQCGEGSGVF